MSLHLLKKVSVLIEVTEKNSDKSVQGSGIIIKHIDKHYVLTAEHCINGREDTRLTGILPSDISIDFNKVKLDVTSILVADRVNDYAILELKSVANYNSSIIYSTSINIDEEDCQLYGFPEVIKGKGRLFRSKLVSKERGTLTISSNDFHKDSSSEDAIGNVQGLSGSGVFIVDTKTKVLVLVGIVKTVRGDNVIYGDMICNDVGFLPEFIDGIELSSFDFVNKIEFIRKSIREVTSKEAINNWEKENNDGFKKIKRKCSLLYHHNKLNNTVYNYVKQYLIGTAFLDEIYSIYPEQDEEIREYIYEFGIETENDYSKKINNKDEGLEIIHNLKEQLKDGFKNLDIPKKKIITLKNYSIAEYLRECSLDFK